MRRAIVLDTETTGLDSSKAKLLEIALKVVNTETGECLGSFQSVVTLSEKEWRDADPGALKINGFTWEDIQSYGRSRNDIAVDICGLFSNLKLTPSTAFFLCQNPSFDRAFFSQLCPLSVQKTFRFPYYWLDFASMNWALTAKDIVSGEVKPFCIPFSKDAIACQRGLSSEGKPHKAMNGVDHLFLLYTEIIGFPRSPGPSKLKGAVAKKTPISSFVKDKSRRTRTPTRFFEP